MRENSPKISIFIPIYNGEKYLSQTLDSILSQTFQDFEVICVDDCSKDNSMKILLDYTKKDNRFKVYKTEHNLGNVPKVLNYAIAFIKGEYFVYSSQDDLFSMDWLSCMYQRAQETGADAVIPNLVLYYQDDPKKNKALIGLEDHINITLTNREAFEYSLDWRIPGNALWNINLLNKFGFYDFSMNADEYTARVYFLNSNKVVFSCGTFFYRQDNPNAITKKISLGSLDMPYTNFKLWQLLIKNDFSRELQEKLAIDSIIKLVKLNAILMENSHLKNGQQKIEFYYSIFQQELIAFINQKTILSKKYFMAKIALTNLKGFNFLSYYYFYQNKTKRILQFKLNSRLK